MLVGNIVQEKITSTKRKKKASGGIFSVEGQDNELMSREVSPSRVVMNPIWAFQVYDDRSADIELMKKAGERMLGDLNNIRIAMLTGELTEDHLLSLSDALEKSESMKLQPELQEVIDDIRLRAAIEIAKLEKYRLGAS